MKLSRVFLIAVFILAYRQKMLNSCTVPGFDNSSVDLLMYHNQQTLVQVGLDSRYKLSLLRFARGGNRGPHLAVFMLRGPGDETSYIGSELEIKNNIPVAKTYLHTQDIALLKKVFELAGEASVIVCDSFDKSARATLNQFQTQIVRKLQGDDNHHYSYASLKVRGGVDTNEFSKEQAVRNVRNLSQNRESEHRSSNWHRLLDEIPKEVKKTPKMNSGSTLNKHTTASLSTEISGSHKAESSTHAHIQGVPNEPPAPVVGSRTEQNLRGAISIQPVLRSFYSSLTINNLKNFQEENNNAVIAIETNKAGTNMRPVGDRAYDAVYDDDKRYRITHPDANLDVHKPVTDESKVIKETNKADKDQHSIKNAVDNQVVLSPNSKLGENIRKEENTSEIHKSVTTPTDKLAKTVEANKTASTSKEDSNTPKPEPPKAATPTAGTVTAVGAESPNKQSEVQKTPPVGHYHSIVANIIALASAPNGRQVRSITANTPPSSPANLKKVVAPLAGQKSVTSSENKISSAANIDNSNKAQDDKTNQSSKATVTVAEKSLLATPPIATSSNTSPKERKLEHLRGSHHGHST